MWQLVTTTVCWSALLTGLYIWYIVWPNHDFAGLQVGPLQI